MTRYTSVLGILVMSALHAGSFSLRNNAICFLDSFLQDTTAMGREVAGNLGFAA